MTEIQGETAEMEDKERKSSVSLYLNSSMEMPAVTIGKEVTLVVKGMVNSANGPSEWDKGSSVEMNISSVKFSGLDEEPASMDDAMEKAQQTV